MSDQESKKCEYCGLRDAQFMTDKLCMEPGKLLCGLCFMIADYAIPNFNEFPIQVLPYGTSRYNEWQEKKYLTKIS